MSRKVNDHVGVSMLAEDIVQGFAHTDIVPVEVEGSAFTQPD